MTPSSRGPDYSDVQSMHRMAAGHVIVRPLIIMAMHAGPERERNAEVEDKMRVALVTGGNRGACKLPCSNALQLTAR